MNAAAEKSTYPSPILRAMPCRWLCRSSLMPSGSSGRGTAACVDAGAQGMRDHPLPTSMMHCADVPNTRRSRYEGCL